MQNKSMVIVIIVIVIVLGVLYVFSRSSVKGVSENNNVPSVNEMATPKSASGQPGKDAASQPGAGAELKTGQSADIKESSKTMNEPQATTELKKEVLQQGSGPEAKQGDTVRVHYTGTLTSGSKFDSSRDRGTPFSFKLGAGMVIKGWDQGVAGMKVGEKVKLTIPADLGYGQTGFPPVIPGGATLIFEIELLGIN